MTKILLVGELNPYGADPDMALYPLPEHASGNRLRQILGLSLSAYLHDHDRVNLCTGKWSLRAARDKAEEIMREREPLGHGLVLCGRRVTDAFTEPGSAWPLLQVVRLSNTYVALLPHPSGLNRLWNDPATAVKAREVYTELAQLVRL
jgi:hypothetical protein